jgi:membrane-associated phospholipid phosphatase
MGSNVNVTRASIGAMAVGWSIRTARAGIPPWDVAGFRAINGLPGWLSPIVWGPMQAGALASPLVVAGAVALRGDRRTAARIATTGVTAWGIAKVVKGSVERGRPGDREASTVLRLGSADHGYGYPSGHAAVAATLAVALPGGAGRSIALGATVLAGIVGISRIYVGAHYPLDVLGGWALGTVIGDAYRATEAWALSSGAT